MEIEYHSQKGKSGGPTRIRTRDTRIFNLHVITLFPLV